MGGRVTLSTPFYRQYTQYSSGTGLPAAGFSDILDTYEHKVNVTWVNGGSTSCVMAITDGQGNIKNYTFDAYSPLYIKYAIVRSFTVTGQGNTVSGVFSWSDQVDPSSIAVSSPTPATVTISGTVPVNVSEIGGTAQTGTTIQTNIAAVGGTAQIGPSVGTVVKGPLTVSGYVETYNEGSP